MTHSCPDGKHTKLVRDAGVPVGERADMKCPRCGYVFDQAEEARAKSVLTAYAASHR